MDKNRDMCDENDDSGGRFSKNYQKIMMNQRRQKGRQKCHPDCRAFHANPKVFIQTLTRPSLVVVLAT
jgi:hypothetical protein